jgi:exodeoxyribonuclease VII large subunit
LVREKNGRAAALVQRLARAHGADVVERRGQQVDGLVHGLQNAMDRLLERASAGFETTAASLAALNPERPLEQGYGLVRVRNSGKFLRSPGEVSPGDVLDIRVREGSVTARVTEESEENR